MISRKLTGDKEHFELDGHGLDHMKLQLDGNPTARQIRERQLGSLMLQGDFSHARMPQEQLVLSVFDGSGRDSRESRRFQAKP